MLKENVWIYVQRFGKAFCDLNPSVRKDGQIELHIWPGAVGHTCNSSHLGACLNTECEVNLHNLGSVLSYSFFWLGMLRGRAST